MHNRERETEEKQKRKLKRKSVKQSQHEQREPVQSSYQRERVENVDKEEKENS